MSNVHAGHNHTHGMAKQSLRIAFGLTIVILLAELVGGLLANSLALLSDAGHVVTDLFAIGLAWFAAVQAERPPNAHNTFGYHRVGILAAFINAMTLIGIAAVIIWEAVLRFQHPEPVQPLIMFLSAAIGIAVNLFIGFKLRAEGENLNVRAASLHALGDVAVSVGVIVAGIVILLTGWTILDPLLSVGISILIAMGTWKILRETIDILLEAVPSTISVARLVEDMKAVEGVRDVHDLHVWSVASEMNSLSCHVLIDNIPPSLSAPILQNLTGLLNQRYHIGHTTIQFECSDPKGGCCDVPSLYCSMEAARERCHDHTHEDGSAHEKASSSGKLVLKQK